MKSARLSMRFKAKGADHAEVLTRKLIDSLPGDVGLLGKHVACDRCDAKTGPYPTFAEALTAAREAGWTRQGTDDICPAHQETA